MTATLIEKRGTYQYILRYINGEGKSRQKWVNTNLPLRGNKRKAEMKEEAILLEWQPKLEPDNTASHNSTAITMASDEKPVDSVSENQPKGMDVCGKTLFSDYMLYWLEAVKYSIQITTYSGYKQLVENHIAPHFKDMGLLLEEIKPIHIQQYYDYLINNRGLSPNTVLHYHANIRKALQYALQLELIPSNPATLVKRPQKIRYVAETYSKEELAKLFEIIRNDSLFLAIYMDVAYGMRRSELLGIKWSTVDFGRKTISVRNAVVRPKVDGEYKLIVKPILKNKSSVRTFPLIPAVEELLIEEKKRQETNKKLFKSCYCNEYLDFVFVEPLGNLMKPNYLTDHFKDIIEKNNLKYIRFHDLRHTCATLLQDDGVDLKDIQNYLGHSNLSTTADIYAHRDFTHQKRTANVAAHIVGEAFEKAKGA